MADTDTRHTGFPSQYVEHPLLRNSGGSLNPNAGVVPSPLPYDLEQAIGEVQYTDIVRLAERMPRRMRDHIAQALPEFYPTMTSTYHQTMRGWFQDVFGNVERNSDSMEIVHRLSRSDIVIRADVLSHIFHDPASARDQLLRYSAQAFLRGILTDLQPHHPQLARGFMNALQDPDSVQSLTPVISPDIPLSLIDPLLRPPPINRFQPQPTINSFTPQPAINPFGLPPLVNPFGSQPLQQASMSPADATATVAKATDLSKQPKQPTPKKASSKETELYYWCPLCDCKTAGKVEMMRNLYRHWLHHHYRSNRKKEELIQMRKDGYLGPWTEEEAAKQKTRKPETEEQRKKRMKMGERGKLWEERMRKDPVKWERVAQKVDGYPSFDATFVSHLRRRIWEAREARKARKAKAEEGEEE